MVLVNWSGAWAVSYTFNFLMSWSSPGNTLLRALLGRIVCLNARKTRSGNAKLRQSYAFFLGVGTFYMYSAFAAMTIIFVAKMVPETKGKTLEEIQVCIRRET